MPTRTQIRDLEPACYLLTALYESRVLFVLLRLCTKALITKHEVSLSGVAPPSGERGGGEVKSLSAERKGAVRYTVERTDRA